VSEGERGQQAYGLGRILALSDGVFAFSLTLLVVTLSVPTATSNSVLASQLLDQAPTYFSYIISFVAVASIWYGHHESFKYIRRYDGRLIALNFGSPASNRVPPLPDCGPWAKPTGVAGRRPLCLNASSEQPLLRCHLVARESWTASGQERPVATRRAAPFLSDPGRRFRVSLVDSHRVVATDCG